MDSLGLQYYVHVFHSLLHSGIIKGGINHFNN